MKDKTNGLKAIRYKRASAEAAKAGLVKNTIIRFLSGIKKPEAVL
ncbi:MAG: hypothetical protein RI556_02475 [Hydrogenovibrio sp.]|nr:hypothetical protein [Hydrogenovibrio sp.]MDR9498015.1 hypothetical protein [Hydrogenovibrio sp.]